MKKFSETLSRFWSNEISQEQLENEFRNYFTEQDIIIGLENVLFTKDLKELDAILHIAFTFNLFTKKSTYILGKLLTQVWHKQHEDIARVFHQLKDPNSIPFLMEGVHIKCDYWYDDADAFIRKCLYALAEINTEEALSKIEILSNDTNEIVRKYAIEQINKVKNK